FPAEARRARFETRRNLSQGFVPRGSLEIARVLVAGALVRDSPHRIENTFRRVHPVEIFRDLGAQEPACYGMTGVPLNLGSTPVLDRNQYSAGIRAVVMTRSMNNVLHELSIIWSDVRSGGLV